MCNVWVPRGSPHNSIYANLQSLGSYLVKYSMDSLRETNKTDLKIVGCWVVGRSGKGVGGEGGGLSMGYYGNHKFDGLQKEVRRFLSCTKLINNIPNWSRYPIKLARK